MSTEEALELAQELRGVRDPCPVCHGLGRYTYGSTSTWRGGWGGAEMTVGVCDACWGSGDKSEPGANLRQMEAICERQARDLEELKGELRGWMVSWGFLLFDTSLGREARRALRDLLDKPKGEKKT